MDHESLDVYQVSLSFASWAYGICKNLNGINRHARDQLIRASQSIVLNIAEGCGRETQKDRVHFLRISAGSTRECGAILDILYKSSILEEEKWKFGKALLIRIISMLKKFQSYLYTVNEEEPDYSI